jgi:hypothetical protein
MQPGSRSTKQDERAEETAWAATFVGQHRLISRTVAGRPASANRLWTDIIRAWSQVRSQNSASKHSRLRRLSTRFEPQGGGRAGDGGREATDEQSPDLPFRSLNRNHHDLALHIVDTGS